MPGLVGNSKMTLFIYGPCCKMRGKVCAVVRLVMELELPWLMESLVPGEIQKVPLSAGRRGFLESALGH